jgi:MAF protein
MLPLILASSSQYRKKLLSQLQLDFECCSPNIDESPLSDESAEGLVARLSAGKAEALATQFKQHLIIGSDQVAVLGDQILSKPGNHENAFQQLSHCSGREVCFYTGLSLLNSATGNIQTIVEPFHVKFRLLDKEQIERYLQTEKPYDCAGSFKVEGLGISLFEWLRGDDPNSLVGLPLIRLVDLLSNEGAIIP